MALSPRHCKVITTCFAGREIRWKTTLCGDPPGPFQHAQVFPDAEAAFDLFRVVYALECNVDPGVPCDTIVVNNDAGWAPGNAFLRQIDGTCTRTGTLRVLTRENFGTSLGGYNHAFQCLRDRYEYWLFTEDDILLTGDRYFARSIDAYEREAGTGFLAAQGLSREPALHAHGGVGLTHRDVLDRVSALWGYLPHRLADESQMPEDHCIFGEVLFTNLIERLGYQLRVLDGPPIYEFAYEYMKERSLLKRRLRMPILQRLPRLRRR